MTRRVRAGSPATLTRPRDADDQRAIPAGPNERAATPLSPGPAWSGWAWRAAVLLGALLVALLLPTTERYAAEIESLAGVDWLETRPPFNEAGGVPSSSTLVRGAQSTWPALAAKGDVIPYQPSLQAPSVFQHQFGSIRDAAELDLAPPPDAEPADLPATLQAQAIVFYRNERASGWLDMMTAVYEIDNGTGQGPAYRTGGPDGSESVWVFHPQSGSPMGRSVVLAQVGVVGMAVEVHVDDTSVQRSDQVSPRATAQSEVLARELASRWRTWLLSTLGQNAE